MMALTCHFRNPVFSVTEEQGASVLTVRVPDLSSKSTAHQIVSSLAVTLHQLIFHHFQLKILVKGKYQYSYS